MRGRISCFVIVLQMVSWVCITSRVFPPNDGDGAPHLQTGADQNSDQSLEVPLSSTKGSKRLAKMKGEPSFCKGWSKPCSSPPSCEHKCFGCNPCEATQVPAAAATAAATSSSSTHFGIEYTNYEPEGWKCKCGSSFYNP